MKAVDIVGSDLKGDAIIPFLVQVKLPHGTFLVVKESLSRIGLPGASGDDGKPTLNQTCHILYKRGKYFICHFKTMFVLDSRDNNLVEADIARQNAIINLLEGWGLFEVVDPEMIATPVCSLKGIKVVAYQDRNKWNLANKYDVGRRLRK